MSSFPSFDQLYGFNQHIGQPYDAGPQSGASEHTQAIRNRNNRLLNSTHSSNITDSIERINFVNHDDYQMNTIIHNENPHFIGDEI